MREYSTFKIASSNEASAFSQSNFVKGLADLCKHGVTLSLTVWIVVGRAAAQTNVAPRCNGPSSPAVEDLVVFLGELHGIAFEVAFPAAGVFYAWVGLLWMSGIQENQRKARRYFVNTTIGLIIVLLSPGIVDIISDVFCGGGA